MDNNYYRPIRNSRVEQHAKRKKTNFILNILIGVVLIAILFVGGNVLFGGNNDTAGEATSPAENGGKDTTDENNNPDDENESPGTGEDQEDPNDSENGSGSGDEPGDENAEPGEDPTGEEPADEDTDLIIEESNDPNVLQSVVNPNWQPVGTVQTDDHVTEYGEGTADREEMEKALAYAVETDVDNMIFWWLETGEVYNKHVIGTVSTRDNEKVYRIYLEWIDGQGWKPTKYEELKENDKR